LTDFDNLCGFVVTLRLNEQELVSNMAEQFNFSKHLRQIIRPVLASFGFRMKGTKFNRYLPELPYSHEVCFQRSQFNNSISPSTFYLNLALTSDDNQYFTQGRIDRITNEVLPEPCKVLGLRSLSNEHRIEIINSLTEEQKSQYLLYMKSKRWEYFSEEELIELFNESKSILIEICSPFFSLLDDRACSGLKSGDLTVIAFEYLNAFYEQHIPEASKFLRE
jgi:hypothetical protein